VEFGITSRLYCGIAGESFRVLILIASSLIFLSHTLSDMSTVFALSEFRLS
jgi:hypothetical protein